MSPPYIILVGLATLVFIPWLFVLLAALRRGRRISNCPKCLSDRLRPSWPRMRDKLLLRISFIRPYRCEACRKRFYVRA